MYSVIIPLLTRNIQIMLSPAKKAHTHVGGTSMKRSSCTDININHSTVLLLQQTLLTVVFGAVFGGHCHLRLQEGPSEVLTAGLVNWGGGQSGASGCLHRPMKTAACLQGSIIASSVSLSCYSHSPADPAHEFLRVLCCANAHCLHMVYPRLFA